MATRRRICQIRVLAENSPVWRIRVLAKHHDFPVPVFENEIENSFLSLSKFGTRNWFPKIGSRKVVSEIYSRKLVLGNFGKTKSCLLVEITIIIFSVCLSVAVCLSLSVCLTLSVCLSLSLFLFVSLKRPQKHYLCLLKNVFFSSRTSHLSLSFSFFLLLVFGNENGPF